MILYDKLTKLNNLFFDTAPIIYFIEAHPDYGQLMKEMIAYSQANNISLFSSVITLTEVLTKPIEKNNIQLADKFSKFLKNNQNITLLEISLGIAEKAGELCGKYKFLKTVDSLQLAMALYLKVDMFVTNDKQLKKVKEIKTLILDDYL